MDQWQSLRHYEERQREERASREQQREEERQQTALQEQARHAAHERRRQEAEQRRIANEQAAQLQAQEQKRREEEARIAQVLQQAEGQRKADQQRNEAIALAALRAQDAQQAKEKGSPIENDFHEVWCTSFPLTELKRQYPIGRYRVDFAHPETKMVIELDGHLFHSTRKDRNRDYARQREIEDSGWVFIRFTGSEVYANVEGCVQSAYRRIQERLDEARQARRGLDG